MKGTGKMGKKAGMGFRRIHKQEKNTGGVSKEEKDMGSGRLKWVRELFAVYMSMAISMRNTLN